MNSIMIYKKLSCYILGLVVLFASCNIGLETTQEPHDNPFDPGYHAADGRLILGEPYLAEGSTTLLRIHWKDIHSDDLLSQKWDYAVYYFGETEKETVFNGIQKGEDPTGSMTAFPGVTFDSDQEYEKRYFDHDISSVATPIYYVVRFTKSDSTNINYSNIVQYPVP